jgi:hypothetical protein
MRFCEDPRVGHKKIKIQLRVHGGLVQLLIVGSRFMWLKFPSSTESIEAGGSILRINLIHILNV